MASPWQDPHHQDDRRTICLNGLPIGDSYISTNVQAMYRWSIKSLKELKEVVEAELGTVYSVRLLTDLNTGKPKTTAFVTMLMLRDADKALEKRSVQIRGVRVSIGLPRVNNPSSHQRRAATPSSRSMVGTNRNPALHNSSTTPAPAYGVVASTVANGRRAWINRTNDALHSRRMVNVNRCGDTVPPSASAALTVRVMTWNVLFPEYINNHSDYCRSEHLDWGHRCGLIAACVESGNMATTLPRSEGGRSPPEILALQEVPDRGPDWDCLEAELRSLGYKCKHLRKSNDRPSSDSLALCWLDRVFALKQWDEFRLSRTSAQVALVAELEHRGTSEPVVVACTHLSAGKEMENDRMKQMHSLLSQTRIRFFAGSTRKTLPPFILCGDLNSEPRWELLQALRKGQPLLPSTDNTHHGFPAFLDCYNEYRDDAYVDKFYTSYSPYQQDTIDYILFCDTDNYDDDFDDPVDRSKPGYRLRLSRVLQVPSSRAVASLWSQDGAVKRPDGRGYFAAIPTASFPSDHIPIMVEFDLVANDKCTTTGTSTAPTTIASAAFAANADPHRHEPQEQTKKTSPRRNEDERPEEVDSSRHQHIAATTIRDDVEPVRRRPLAEVAVDDDAAPEEDGDRLSSIHHSERKSSGQDSTAHTPSSNLGTTIELAEFELKAVALTIHLHRDPPTNSWISSYRARLPRGALEVITVSKYHLGLDPTPKFFVSHSDRDELRSCGPHQHLVNDNDRCVLFVPTLDGGLSVTLRDIENVVRHGLANANALSAPICVFHGVDFRFLDSDRERSVECLLATLNEVATDILNVKEVHFHLYGGNLEHFNLFKAFAASLSAGRAPHSSPTAATAKPVTRPKLNKV